MQTSSRKNPPVSLSRLGILAMLALGLLLLGAAVYQIAVTTTWLKRAVEVEGTVVRMLSHTDKDGDVTFKPIVRFSTADGKTIEFYSSFSSNPPAYRIEQSVRVVYLPEEPERAAIRSFLSLWMGSLVLGLIGAILFGIGAVVLVAGRRVSAGSRSPRRPPELAAM